MARGANSFVIAGLATLSSVAPLSSCAEPAPSSDDALAIGDARIAIEIDPAVAQPREELVRWIERAAGAVEGYVGRFPVERVDIAVERGSSGAHGNPIQGVTYAGERIVVHVDPEASRDEFDRDWVLCHEMFHLAFPTLAQRHAWMMEGLSDYLEPVARARAGQLSEVDVWRELVRGLPQGQPRRSDGGLDEDSGWGRVYWGGAAFWLLADVRIRERTANRRSVADVVRAILAEGGDGGAHWEIGRVLQVGDRATGTSVLRELYDWLAHDPVAVDLAALWRELGVVARRGSVSFDDSAPLAEVRKAITARPLAAR